MEPVHLSKPNITQVPITHIAAHLAAKDRSLTHTSDLPSVARNLSGLSIGREPTVQSTKTVPHDPGIPLDSEPEANKGVSNQSRATTGERTSHKSGPDVQTGNGGFRQINLQTLLSVSSPAHSFIACTSADSQSNSRTQNTTIVVQTVTAGA